MEWVRFRTVGRSLWGQGGSETEQQMVRIYTGAVEGASEDMEQERLWPWQGWNLRLRREGRRWDRRCVGLSGRMTLV